LKTTTSDCALKVFSAVRALPIDSLVMQNFEVKKFLDNGKKVTFRRIPVGSSGQKVIDVSKNSHC